MTPEAGPLAAKLREQRGITQRELADAVGVSVQTISRGERGENAWYPKTCRRIFDTLNSHAPLQESESLALLHAFGLSATMSRRQPSADPRPRFALLPADIEQLVTQMVYVVGPARVLEFLQAAVNLMAASDDVPVAPPAPAASHPKPPRNAVAIDVDSDPDIAARKFIPLRTAPTSSSEPRVPGMPASKPRRRKSG